MSKEFISINKKIKRLIRVTGNVEILENYLKNEENRKKLSSNEIKHLKHRIKIMKELNEIGEKNRKALRENNRTSLIAPITRKDGTVELAHIHQDKVQNTFNGCWSVSLQLLLQSRGVKLTQEQIRGFRHNFVNDEEVKELDEETEKDINQDRKNEMMNKVDLVMKVLPNTAMNSATFMPRTTEIENEKNRYRFEKIVRMSLIEDCSPLSMVSNGHFRTIVGIQGDEVLVKDSIQFRTHGANHTYRVPIKDILKESTKLFWLHDLQMEKDGSCAEFSGNSDLNYKDGAIDFEDMRAFKKPDGSLNNKAYRKNQKKEYRALEATEGEVDRWTRDAKGFKVETRKFNRDGAKPGSYNMNLPKKIYEGAPRKVRSFTEAEIGLIDKLKEREDLEDIQMRLNMPDKNGLYPAMTKDDLQKLNDAYEKVSIMYQDILSDKKINISTKQKNHMMLLKGRVDKERQIFLKLQKSVEKSEDGVLPTYREVLREGMRKLDVMGKNPYEVKAQKLKALQEKFDNLDKEGHKNSKEYTKMMTAAKNLRLVVEAIANPEEWKKLGFEAIPNEDQIDALLKRTEDEAVNAVEKYVNEKGNPYTEFGKNRLAAAKELQEELSNSLNIFREERVEALMKEQARLKEEVSAPKQERPEEKAPEEKQEERLVL